MRNPGLALGLGPGLGPGLGTGLGLGQGLPGAGGGGTTSPRLLCAPAGRAERRDCGEGRGGGGGKEARGSGCWWWARGPAMPGSGARVEEGSGSEGAAPGAAAEPGVGPGREPARLCGYLQKLSGKGPLRGYRSRWFVFDARRCYLYYFKSPQDALPLGHLDIADACFSYQGPDEAAEPGAELPAHFQVHSAGTVTVLKVRPPAPQIPAPGLAEPVTRPLVGSPA